VPTPDQLRSEFTPVQTERLVLRAVEPNDAEAVFSVHGNTETYRFHPDGVTRSLKESMEQLAGWCREWQEIGFGFWAVTVAPDQRVVGFGGLTKRAFHGRPVLNTYYRFDPSAWGHGYATEMASTASSLARSLLPELPMIVRTRPENRAARAVAVKLGLSRRPEFDDHLITYVGDCRAASAATDVPAHEPNASSPG
jgi:ribosomal-protein-alanine N-acetyltransferase